MHTYFKKSTELNGSCSQVCTHWDMNSLADDIYTLILFFHPLQFQVLWCQNGHVCIHQGQAGCYLSI